MLQIDSGEASASGGWEDLRQKVQQKQILELILAYELAPLDEPGLIRGSKSAPSQREKAQFE